MAEKMTADEFLSRYQAGERDFKGIELIDNPKTENLGNAIELKGTKLRGINLRGAKISFVNLDGADLTEADLFGVCLAGSLLRGAILKDANLASANLHWCGLFNADLRGTNLTYINATNASFSGANLELTYFEYAVLARANFRKAVGQSKDSLCNNSNLIWQTIMPDGTLEEGPYLTKSW